MPTLIQTSTHVRRRSLLAVSRLRRAHVLLDVAIGSLVLSFCALAFSSTFTPSQRAGAKSRHLDLATNACYSELEARRKQGVDAIPQGTSAITVSGTGLLRRLPADLPQSTGTLLVQRVSTSGTAPNLTLQPTTADTGRLQLTMTVSWSGVTGDSGTTSVSTLVRR